MNIVIGLIIALAVSVAGNAGLGYLYLGQRDSTVTTEVTMNQAKGAAETCSKSVDDLKIKSDDRLKAATVARKSAAASAAAGDARADEILSTPATSTDDCKAAQDRTSAWLKGRK